MALARPKAFNLDSLEAHGGVCYGAVVSEGSGRAQHSIRRCQVGNIWDECLKENPVN